MSSNIVFEDLETHHRYTSIETFKQAHRGFRLIQRQVISFEGAEDIDHPLTFLLIDGTKIPRYKLFISLSQQIDLDPLTTFLASKHAFWMISSIELWIDMSGNNILKTAKVGFFLQEWKNMIWQLASKQIAQIAGNGPQAPPPMQPVQMPLPPPMQMPQLPPPTPMGMPQYGPQSQQIVPMGPAAAPVPPQAPPAPAAILKSAFPDMFV